MKKLFQVFFPTRFVDLITIEFREFFIYVRLRHFVGSLVRKYFFLPVACFSSVSQSVTEKQVLILMKSNLLIFLILWILSLVVRLRMLFLILSHKHCLLCFLIKVSLFYVLHSVDAYYSEYC